MALNPALTGKRYESFAFPVTAEAIRAYAQATNDGNPAFNSESPIGPPCFPFVAAAGLFDQVFMDPDLGVDMAMLVHAEQDHRLFEPIKATDVLDVSTVIESIDLADTGHSFTVAIDLTNQDGQLAARVRSTMLIRKSGTGAKAVENTVEHSEPVAEAESVVDQDQTYRYAEASGDHNPIHVDREHARKSGFPGVVLHGMCTMAMASQAVLDGVAGGDPGLLRRISVVFSRPVFPGQTLTTRIWPLGEGSFGFETVNPRNAAVIKNGIAELMG